MAIRKPVTKTEQLRRNVMATIRRAEKKGYTFSEDVKRKAASGNYQSLKSLQGNRYKNLYEQSKVEGAGATFSGAYYRNVIGPRVAATKAAITRKSKEDKDYEKKRKKLDEEAKKKAKNALEGEIIFAQMLGIINEFAGTPGAKGLNEILRGEIEKYGFNNVMRTLSNAPSSIVADARTLARYDGTKSEHQRAYHNVVKLLRSSRLSAEEGKITGAMMDQI